MKQDLGEAPAVHWPSRIVRRETAVDPTTLTANPSNWRRHPDHQAAALTDVLDSVGWVAPVIVNVQTGLVVDGHLRVALATERGETVPVDYVDLTPAEEALVLATFDPISALAESDAEALDALLRTVDTGSAAVQSLLDTLATDAGLVPSSDEDDEEQPAEPPAKTVDDSSGWVVMVHCTSEEEQADLLDRLTDEGFTCRAIVA
jgi:ParB-like chromosome segregation protein Spo0J